MTLQEFLKEISDERRDKILAKAIEFNDGFMAELVIRAGANINADKDFIIAWASAKGHYNVLKLMEDE